MSCPQIKSRLASCALDECVTATFVAIHSLSKVKTFISCYRTPGPQKGCRRVSEGVPEGVSEGLSKGFRRVLEGVSRGPF